MPLPVFLGVCLQSPVGNFGLRADIGTCPEDNKIPLCYLCFALDTQTRKTPVKRRVQFYHYNDTDISFERRCNAIVRTHPEYVSHSSKGRNALLGQVLWTCDRISQDRVSGIDSVLLWVDWQCTIPYASKVHRQTPTRPGM